MYQISWASGPGSPKWISIETRSKIIVNSVKGKIRKYQDLPVRIKVNCTIIDISSYHRLLTCHMEVHVLEYTHKRIHTV